MNLTLEEQYLELLNKIVYPTNRMDSAIEHRIIEAHKIVSARHKFEQVMCKAYQNIDKANERDRF